MATFTPTAEQNAAVEAAMTGGDLKMIAGAGAGKTSTLRLIAEAMGPERGIRYIAFNKAIVTEVKGKFPTNTTASTIHSIAWNSRAGKAVTWKVKQEVRQPTYRECAEKLGMVDPNLPIRFDKGEDGDFVELYPTTLARLAHDAAGRWCQTADAELTVDHCFLHVPGLDKAGSRENTKALARRLFPMAAKIAVDWMDPNSHRYRTTHAAYLKRWFDDSPLLATDVLLVDEAQDLNPLMLGIIEANREVGCQVILVGDPAQQIYSWNGAVDSLDQVDTEHTTYLTESFRFGEDVAEIANGTLAAFGHPIQIVGSGPEGTVGFMAEADAVLGRTNSGVVAEALHNLSMGKEVALQGGTWEIASFAKGAQALMDGRRSDHPELCAFKDWAEVVEAVEKGDDGGELKTLVKLVEDFGPSTLMGRLTSCIDPARAKGRRWDILCSTAHKSKGGEWGEVRLLDDWPKDNPSIEDLRLLYVAQTRAMVGLECEPVTSRTIETYLENKKAETALAGAT